jgi:tetratricopeptide (TPR) repeat protein
MNVRKLIWLAIMAFVFIISCNRNANNTLLQEIGQSQTCILQLLQQIDSKGNMGEYDADLVKDYIAKVEAFRNEYPEDPKSPEFLYKAALMAMTLAKVTENHEETALYSQKALTIFDDIQRIYPDFNRIKNCMFNKGVVYDDILHDYENAEFFYRAFMAIYPTDTLAINLEIYLQYLGKSPEDILGEI